MNNSQVSTSPFSNYRTHPELNPLDKTLYLLGITVSLINLVVTSLGLYAGLKDFKRLHPNFVILRHCILICFFFIGIGHFSVCFSAVLENLIAPQRNKDIWITGIRVNFFGNDCIRCFFVTIFIERMIATVYSRFYEKSNKIWISLLLICISVSFGISISIIRAKNDDLRNLLYSFGLTIDIIGCIFIYFLRQYNKEKRKLNTRSTVILSQRFQLSENVRILRSIFPIITTGVGISFFGTIYNLAAFNIVALFDYWRYSSALYYLLYNCYCIVATILYAYTDPYYRKKASFPCKKDKVTDKVSCNSTVDQNIMIKNVNGEDIARKITNDEYFKTIQQQWEVSANSIKNNI